MNNISYHQWPPHVGERRAWRIGQDSCGVLAIDGATGYAVASVSERSQMANRELAESRLRTMSDTQDEITDRFALLSSRLIAASKSCDALEDLNEIATKRITELENQHASMIAEIENLMNRINYLESR